MAYGEVWRFNAVADEYDDSFCDSLPNGDSVEALIADKAIRAKIALIRAEQELSGY